MNKHYRAKPEELDAQARFLSICNDLDEYFDQAAEYLTNTIKAARSRLAVARALNGIMVYEVAQVTSAQPIQRVVRACQARERYRAKAGQLVDA
jgi:hypothetical protein